MMLPAGDTPAPQLPHNQEATGKTQAARRKELSLMVVDQIHPFWSSPLPFLLLVTDGISPERYLVGL